MADHILDHEKHPEWQGERTKLMYAMPKDEKHWGEYKAILDADLIAGLGMTRATAYYAKHRTAMDAGARAGWEARFNHDELSAIQNAMNLKFRDEAAFYAEYQNEPSTSRTTMSN